MAVIQEASDLAISDSVVTSYPLIIIGVFVLFLARQPPSGPGPPHSLGL